MLPMKYGRLWPNYSIIGFQIRCCRPASSALVQPSSNATHLCNVYYLKTEPGSNNIQWMPLRTRFANDSETAQSVVQVCFEVRGSSACLNSSDVNQTSDFRLPPSLGSSRLCGVLATSELTAKARRARRRSGFIEGHTTRRVTYDLVLRGGR